MIDHTPAVSRPEKIGLNGLDTDPQGAKLAARLSQFLFTPGTNGHISAFFGKGQCDLTADPPAAAGD